MKVIRIIIAVVFFWLIVFGFMKWNESNYTIEKNWSFASIEQTFRAFFSNDTSNNNDASTPGNDAWNDSVNTPWTPWNGDTRRLHEDITQWTLSDASFRGLTEDTVFVGPEQSPFALFIWCDFDSSYCKEFYDNADMTTYQLAFQDRLQVYFKGYATKTRWLNSTYNTHHARLCGEKLWNWPQRTRLQQFLFNNPYVSIETLVEQWDRLWIDWFAWCLLTSNSNERLETQKLQAKNLFSIRALPSFVFYNKSTQQWFLIPWYYDNIEIAESLAFIAETQK